MTNDTLFVPRPYQVEATQFAIQHGRVILGDVMGLGKTGQALLAREYFKPRTTLVIAGRNAQLVWKRQPARWGLNAPTRIRGTPEKRRQLWAGDLSYVTCTIETLRRDFALVPKVWDLIIVDEAHKLANRKAGNYKALKALRSRWMLLLTGSPFRKAIWNIWALLNILDPRTWSSYWSFINRFCHVQRGVFGMEIIGIKDMKGLRLALSNYLIRRSKKQVRPDMPPKRRDYWDVELTSTQAKLYNKLVEDMILEVDSIDGASIIASPSIMVNQLRLRQLLVTPKLLDPSFEDGAAIDELVERLAETNDHHMVIFTPFKEAIPFIEARLRSEGYNAIIKLHGGISLNQLEKRLAEFTSTQGIAICTIKFAESFDLVPATWAVFLGYEWVPDDNFQAEDRLHRGEITDPIDIWYIRHSGTVDEDQLKVLNERVKMVNDVFGRKDEYLKLLRDRLVPQNSS